MKIRSLYCLETSGSAEQEMHYHIPEEQFLIISELQPNTTEAT